MFSLLLFIPSTINFTSSLFVTSNCNFDLEYSIKQAYFDKINVQIPPICDDERTDGSWITDHLTS